jgi:hypothetical protein
MPWPIVTGGTPGMQPGGALMTTTGGELRGFARQIRAGWEFGGATPLPRAAYICGAGGPSKLLHPLDGSALTGVSVAALIAAPVLT